MGDDERMLLRLLRLRTVGLDGQEGDLLIELQIASAALPCTANLAIVYGICLKSIGTNPE